MKPFFVPMDHCTALIEDTIEGPVEYYTDHFQGAHIFRYQWHHIPSGKKGESQIYGVSSIENQKKLINHWNRKQPNNWIYKRIRS